MTGPIEPTPIAPRRFALAIVALLTAQLGLLWMQGSMLERQHGDLQSLRQDVQDLSENLEQFEGSFDQGASDSFVQPSAHRLRGHRRGRALRVRLEQPSEGDEGVKKQLEESKKSQREQVDKAYELKAKLSLAENARIAEEKAKLEAAAHPTRRLASIAMAVVLGVLIVGFWLKRRT
jgi:hypothetical protein